MTPTSLVLLNKIFLADASGDQHLALTGALVTPEDGLGIKILLTEYQRSIAIAISGTAGGNGGALYVEFLAGAMQDIGQRPNDAQTGIVASETADTTKPVMDRVEINYGTGLITYFMSETIDATPAALINVSKLYFGNAAGTEAIGSRFYLSNSSVVAHDNVTVQVTMPERTRSNLIAISGTSGGDSGAVYAKAEAGALRDVGTNLLDASEVLAEEVADIIKPLLLSATINYGTGEVVFASNEILDSTPVSKVDLSKIHVSNAAGTPDVTLSSTWDEASRVYQGRASATVTSADEKVVKVLMNEGQRLAALKLSGTPGGAGGAVVLDFDSGAIQDVAENGNAAVTGISVTEIADTVAPTLIYAELFLSEGVLRITADETIRGTATSSYMDLGHFSLHDATATSTIELAGATIQTTEDVRVNITLTELQRVQAIALSSTAGGNGEALAVRISANGITDYAGNKNPSLMSVTAVEYADTVSPLITDASIEYSTGLIQLTFTETIDVTPISRVNLSGIFVSTSSGAKTVALSGATLEAIDRSHLNITMTELQRSQAIAISGTSGGDSSAVVLDFEQGSVVDIGTNALVAVSGVSVLERADTVIPVVERVYVSYDQPLTITVQVSEIVDQTPASKVDLSKIRLVQSTGATATADKIELTTGTLTSTDSVNITVTLTEVDRAKAIAMSGLTGGDGGALVVDIDAGMFVDIAQLAVAQRHNVVASEIPDTTAPIVTAGDLHVGLFTLVITSNEYIDCTPASRVDLSKIFLGDQPLDTTVPLAGATVTSEDGYNVTITMNEAQRTSAVPFSALPGGDGTASRVNLQPGAIMDIAQNPNSANLSVANTEAPDLNGPVVVSASLHLGTGILTVTSSETMDSTINGTLMHLAQTSAAKTVNLASSQGLPPNGQSVQIQLSEEERVAALPYSSDSRVGDSGALVLDLSAHSMTDVSQNPIVDTFNIALVETMDTILPTIQSINLNLSTGVLQIVAVETIDATPVSNIVLNTMHIADWSGDQQISLVGASVAAVDSPTVTITLTEAQRIKAIEISGTPGGNGNSTVLDISSSGAMRDMSTNLMATVSGFTITEVNDTVAPVITAASVNYNNGVIVVSSSETLDLTPASKVTLGSLHFEDSFGDRAIALTGATVTSADGTQLTITMTEAQRQAAIRISGTAGGNSGAVTLHVGVGGVLDVGQVPNVETSAVAVTETEDTTRPQMTAAALNYSTGSLTITSSETIDVNPESLVDLTKLSLSNTAGAGTIALTGATVTPVDGVTIEIVLTEAQRASAVGFSGLSGGDGGALILDILSGALTDVATQKNQETPAGGCPGNCLTLTEGADVILPKVLSAALNYSTGSLVVQISETVDATPASSNIDLTKFFLADVSGDQRMALRGGAEGTAQVLEQDATSLSITLTELQRITALGYSGVSGGNGSPIVLDIMAGGFVDVAQNANADAMNTTVSESPELLPPTLSSATIDLSFGTVVLLASEYLDTTPASKVDLSKLFLENSGGDKLIPLTGATVLENDFSNVTLSLTELQRSQAIANSGTSGGDSGAMTVRAESGAVVDIAQNPNALFPSLALSETADTVHPVPLSATIDYSTGTITVAISEILDITPASNIRLDGLHLSNRTGDHIISLVGSVVTATDATQAVIVMPEAKRAIAIANSGTPGGNGHAMVLDVARTTFMDIALNRNEYLFNLTLQETADTVAPAITAAAINYGTGVLTIT